MVAITTFLAVIAVSLVLTRIATVVLVATGMSRESARFQARSALTGTGFTTRESEQVLEHPVRRRVIMLVMLLGSAGLVAAASSLILGFRSSSRGESSIRVLVLLAGVVVLVFLSRSRRVDRLLTRAVSHVLHTRTDLARRDIGRLAHLADGYAVAELAVQEGDWMAGRRVEEVQETAAGVLVLGVQHRGGNYEGAPRRDLCVEPGDVLIVYGRQDALDELDRRPADDVAAQQRRSTS